MLEAQSEYMKKNENNDKFNFIKEQIKETIIIFILYPKIDE